MHCYEDDYSVSTLSPSPLILLNCTFNYFLIPKVTLIVFSFNLVLEIKFLLEGSFELAHLNN